jgi:preprotein translocase subunit YajC
MFSVMLGAATTSSARLMSTVGIMAVWLVILYFIMVLPNKRKNKKHNEMINGLKAGDTVVTIGGIKADVISVNEEYLELKLDQKGNRITLKKSAVSQVIK